MPHLIENIKSIIETAYEIGPILSIERFHLSASKFTSQNYHFLIETSNKKFFLKKYYASQLRKLISELSVIKRLNKIINIPLVIAAKDGDLYVRNNDMIFVLYEYIDALNLRDTNEPIKDFFDVLCSIENKLVALESEDLIFYDFGSHIRKFESKSKDLLKIIKNQNEIYSESHKNYIEFLITEVANFAEQIKYLKIPKHLIHGDLLMQNLIRDTSNIMWVIDWEKSTEYITSVDALRSVLFTIFDPTKENMGLDTNLFIQWVGYCLEEIPLSQEEKNNAIDLYYFHSITNLDFLERFYIQNQALNENRIDEDFFICKWLKSNKKAIQYGVLAS